jgi:hypothetical protein
VATINMGFDAEEEDAGPFLDPLNPQSRYAPTFLEYFLGIINNDPEYLKRLQRHYMMFKEKVDRKPYQGRPFDIPGKTTRVQKDPVMPGKVRKAEGLQAAAAGDQPVRQQTPKVGRNQACPCGSGKKYKRCCMLKEESRQGATTVAAPGKEATGTAVERVESKDGEDLSFNRDDMVMAKAFVKTVAGRLKREEEDPVGRDIQAVLEGNPQIAFALLGLLMTFYAAKNPRKKRDESYRAILALLEEALTQLRYSVERGRSWAIKAANRIQETMAENAFRIEVDTEVQAGLMQVLYSSRLELHPEIRAKREELADYYGRFIAQNGPPDLNKLFDRMAKAGPDDPFELYQQLMAELSTLSAEAQLFAVLEMVRSHNPVIGEAAALMLLHPDREVRVHIPAILGASGDVGAVSPAGLRRMIGLRNWLPKEERPELDHLIKAARLAGVECAAMPAVQAVETYASVFDGAGMEALWGFSKKARDYQMGGILVKQGQGVRETWGERRLKKGEKKSFIGQITGDSSAIPIEPAYLERVIGHFLWVGKEGNIPPPGLLQAAEILSDNYWAPKPLDFEREIAALEAEMPPRFLQDESVAKVLDESREWPDMPFGSSWFEDDARVDALVRENIKGSSDSDRTIARTRDLILREILEEKRRSWGERLFWMAFRERSCIGKSRLPWEAFVIVSRMLLSGAPLERIPLMGAVAERSILSGLRRIHEFPK